MTPVPVLVTGLAVRTACGTGTTEALAAVLAAEPAFAPVTRFDLTNRQTIVAATRPGSPGLAGQLVEVLAEAGADAARGAPVLLALHGDERAGPVAAEVAARLGPGRPLRVYTGACVAAGTAVADAAALIAAGRAEQVVVAAGYLVEPDTFAVFDAGRALSRSGALRPFSRDRDGLLLGDAVVALVLRAGPRPGALARIAGWGRAGDGHHVCRPDPSGAGLARAVRSALVRAGVRVDQLGWVNANGTGSPLGDRAEAAALALAFGDRVDRVPVSSTKAVHGHALEASALLELALTIGVLREGKVPVNAGWQEPDEHCPLDLVLGAPRELRAPYLLSVNSAFGGANTALLVGEP
jgi:3-oxoacyl-[acyl-carrier-protein] synthase II